MKVTTEKPEPGVATLTIEIPSDEFDRALDGAWRRVANRINIPGFRRGKAPRPLVERHAGSAAIDEEALRRLLPQSYDKAVEEAGLHPIERPSFDIVQVERGRALVFKATVPLRPTVELGDYHTVTIEPEQVAVSDEEVDRVIDQLRERQAQWLPVEDRAVEMGDMVIADVTISLPPADGEGEPRTSERKDSEVILGENGYPKGFDEQLAGTRPGDTREFTLTWEVSGSPASTAASTNEPSNTTSDEASSATTDEREESPAPEQRSATFTVAIKEVKRKDMPALDDELARSLGNHDTLEELRADVRRRLYADALRAARNATENKVVDAAIEQATFEIADRLIEAETDALAQERERSLAQQGIVLERYLSMIGTTSEAWRAEMREQAVRQIKARVLLDEIADREQVTVAPDEVTAEIEAAALSYGDQAAQVRRALSSDESARRIAASLRRHKAIQVLVEAGGGYPVDELGVLTSSEEEEDEGGEAYTAPGAVEQSTEAGSASDGDVAGAVSAGATAAVGVTAGATGATGATGADNATGGEATATGAGATGTETSASERVPGATNNAGAANADHTSSVGAGGTQAHQAQR